MNRQTGMSDRCPACRKGRLRAAEYLREFAPHGEPVAVKLQTSRCAACGETTTTAAQHRDNLRALAARKAAYRGLLLGEEILALRKRYGLTQQQASAVFGKGKIAFSRYESETSYPDASTTLLLALASERPEVMKSLADRAGIALPLWPERCEDGQRVKLRAIPREPLAAHRQRMTVHLLEPGAVPARPAGAAALQKIRTTIRSTGACNDAAALEAVAS